MTISDTTPDATIYYTIDGTTPTTNSTVYSGTAIAVSSTETIEAIATASGYTQSATATGTYTISAAQTATPTFNPPGGNYSSAQSVTISDATPNATIYYTTDGTTPTTNSTVYGGTRSPSHQQKPSTPLRSPAETQPARWPPRHTQSPSQPRLKIGPGWVV